MSSRPARRTRATRGLAAAAVATFAATVGHAAGQQALPSPWIVAVAFALAAPVCVALAGRRLSIVRLAAAVVLSQLAFHVLLRLDFTGASAVAAGHHGLAVMTSAGPAMASHDADPAMWAGHALAALATIAVLATGERTLVALADLVRRPFRALTAFTAPVADASPTAIVGPLGVRLSLAPSGLVRRRGPPALV